MVVPFEVLSKAVIDENKLWKMKKMVKILMPFPIIQNMNMFMKICVFELVAIYMSFLINKIKYTFSIIYFLRGSSTWETVVSVVKPKGYYSCSYCLTWEEKLGLLRLIYHFGIA